ncbi:UDP-2,3-diacylglucosamine diphosphatase [Thiomicrospira sp. R3]|uniref:UDP-2,3-diacylglucosamine diphosphatase n=1 Tax=Thiomicrospira sp. R3 TaxID=3035472 RepID=UPI00259BBE1C|nr:UDP-2,3-diacylglucosamine diphosphatase [Thiomicrospira sp. R3]WFE68427.1 UDP-2,3-diacylglucosamine diphosphatase [Thiomicrospira sp. R3]
MAKPCYILADVHLQPDTQHPINQAFRSFLTLWASQADAIYLLGDLFEAWVGDDLGLETYAQDIGAIKALSQQGVQVFIGTGNRDFLLKKAFYRATQSQALDDISIQTIQGTDFILLHGDQLCTDDLQYQKMRRWFHNPLIQWLFLKLPKTQRNKIGQQLRAKSATYSQQKPQQIMDVSNQAVETLLNKHPNIEHLVHGHTHRPAIHHLEINEQTKTRWVLGDWRPEARILKIENGQPGLVPFNIKD